MSKLSERKAEIAELRRDRLRTKFPRYADKADTGPVGPPYRAERRKQLHEARSLARLLGRVAKHALVRRGQPFKDEFATTYGLGREADRMHDLSNEQRRAVHVAGLNRRVQLAVEAMKAEQKTEGGV